MRERERESARIYSAVNYIRHKTDSIEQDYIGKNGYIFRCETVLKWARNSIARRNWQWDSYVN